MTYTQQLRELLNELKLAKGKNSLIFAISERPARLEELIELNGFGVREISLKGKANLLEMLLTWDETTENTIYVVHGIGNQFPWVLPYINLHRDLFFDIKRPVVVLGSEYEITEIQKHAPDWFRFRSRTYELKEEELGEEQVITRLAELAEPKPVYYPLPVFEEEECEEEIKERIKIDEYLLSSERDDYKLAELYMSLSLSLFKLRDFERAEEYLRKSKAIRENLKDNKGILLDYGRLSSIFIGLGEFEQAIEACNEALKIDYDLAWAYITRGVAYAESSQYDKALEDFNQAIGLNPLDAKVYTNRGTAYAKLNQHERAIEDYNKAIELNPNYAETYNNRGNAYAGLNQHERAIEDYNKAIGLNPNDAEAYYNRADAHRKLNQYAKAIEDYSKAIEKNPKFAIAYGNRGVTYVRLNRYEKAFKDYEKAIELDPNFAVAYNNRGLASAKLNQHKRAIDDYNKAIELNPNYAEAHYNRGNTYHELKQSQMAIKDYNKVIELNPNLSWVYNNRGNAFHELNQLKTAIKDYNKAIELDPDYADTYNNRGNTYARLNQSERAIEDYNKAIELNPNLADAYGNRGRTYKEIGNYEESARDLKEASILFFGSRRTGEAVKDLSICFDLRDIIENDDIIYSGLALFLITLNPDVIVELKQLQIEDEPLRKIFELTLMKLRDEDISEGITMLEEKEQTEEKKILFELLKRL